MKTIDLLVQGLPAIGGWPENVTHIGQNYDRELMFYGLVNPRSGIFLDQLADDHRKHCEAGTKITREQYEAALAAKNDGWIEWRGGECPVEKGTLIDVKWRDGRIDDSIQAKVSHGPESPNKRNAISWRHFGIAHDIIAYRLHKPQKAEQAKDNLSECIGNGAAPVWNGEGLPPVGCFCEVEDRDGMLVYGQGEYGEVIAHVENTAVIRMSYGLGCFESGFLRPLRTEAERKRDESIKAMASAPKPCGHPIAGICSEIYDAIAAGKIPGVKLEDL